MIKWIATRKKKAEERKKLKQYKKYYKVVKEGLLFIKFIQQDVADKNSKLNRAQRRRFEKELNKEGKLTEEIVQHYKIQIDNVLSYIEMQLNPPKIKKTKGVDVKNMKVSKNLKEAGASKARPVDPKSNAALKAEYKLVQEKKSDLPLNERKKVVSLYEQRFGAK